MNLRLNFNNFFLFLGLTITCLVSNISNAAEQTIANITKDGSSNNYQLIIDTNEQDQTINTFYKDEFLNGKKLRREALNYKVLNTSGMILEQKNKYVVMSLKSQNFDEQQGGIITVDTLYNGANGSRKTYEIEITKDQNGWILLNQGKVVKSIAIQINKVMFLGEVGIKNLLMK